MWLNLVGGSFMSIAALVLTSVVVSALAAVLCALIWIRLGRFGAAGSPLLEDRLQRLEEGFGRSERAVRDEFARGRDETSAGAKLLREEVSDSFIKLADSLRQAMADLAQGQKAQLDAFAARLNEAKGEAATNAKGLREEVQATLKQLGETISTTNGRLAAVQTEKLEAVTRQVAALTEGNERRQETLRANVEARLGELKSEASGSAKALREEVTASLKQAADMLMRSVTQISDTQRERLNQMTTAVTELAQKTREQQEALRRTVETRLDRLRDENAERLEKMRQTVDEKLQGTLEQRLGASFKLVSDQLEQVYKSVGEMQTLATGVGDLKRVLTNVKTRGIWGEAALGNMLEQLMTPDQYACNVEVRPGSGQRVEYAIRLPGNGNGEEEIWPADRRLTGMGSLRARMLQRPQAESATVVGRAVRTARDF